MKQWASPSLDIRLAMRQRPSDQHIVMYQNWRQLLFLHWVVDPDLVQHTLPHGLKVDTFEGQTYIGLVPFFMCGVRPRFLTSVPYLSNFMEVNVRTYVYDQQGTPGVWFYSLDANQLLAVHLARYFFKLPYFHAQMHATAMTPWGLRASDHIPINYHTWRRGTPEMTASRFVYQSTGEKVTAPPNTLEFFLVERYVLFATPRPRQLATGRVYHSPYPIFKATVTAWDDQLVQLAGFESLHRPPDHILVSPGVDVQIYPIQLTSLSS